MNAVLGFIPPTKWSNCSLVYLRDGINNRNLGVCLTNDPAVTVGTPVCGNGILEGNEICDCGKPAVCHEKIECIELESKLCMRFRGTENY